jgi:hypothetical protein
VKRVLFSCFFNLKTISKVEKIFYFKLIFSFLDGFLGCLRPFIGLSRFLGYFLYVLDQNELKNGFLD